MKRLRVRSIIFISLLALFQAGCSRTFVIAVNGSEGDSITFSFYEFDGDVERTTLNIVEFVVQEQAPDGRWIVSWELQGSRRLDSIDYGAEYDGLDEMAPAKPLSRGRRYRAFASELSWPSPKGQSAVAFSIAEDGSLAVGSTGE